MLLAKPSEFITSITSNTNPTSINKTIKFVGKITKGTDIPIDTKVSYEEFINGILKRKGYASLNQDIILEHQISNPTWYFVRLKMVDSKNKNIFIKNKQTSAGKGILVSPENIPFSSTRPNDFDTFWNLQRKSLDLVPIKVLEKKTLTKNPNSTLVAYDVKISCAGSRPVSGILTIPRSAKLKSLPAFVFFQGAGVSTAVSFGGYGRNAITFMVNAHGIDNMKEKTYYQNLSKTKLKNYAHFSKDNRDKIYFKDMFLRVMRSLDYVKSLPEWNGKILVARGGSQGGAQAIVAAAMDKQVTLLVAEVPAMCNHNGFLAPIPRRSGWPNFYTNKGVKNNIIKATSYYDMINFAFRIHCESYITTGLTDLVCSPIGIACLFNAIASPKKHFLVHPTGDHVSTQTDSQFTSKFTQRIIEHFKE